MKDLSVKGHSKGSTFIWAFGGLGLDEGYDTGHGQCIGRDMEIDNLLESSEFSRWLGVKYFIQNLRNFHI